MAELRNSILAFALLMTALGVASASLRKAIKEGEQWWKILKPLFTKRKARR